VIVCGIQAARGQLSLPLVIVVAAAGAFAGDNTSYAGGRFLGGPIQRRFFDGERARHRLEWAKGFLGSRGASVFLVARFIPAGRTATTFTAGLIRYRWLMRFVPFDLIASIAWAVYCTLLGYLGGHTFEDRPLLALVLAFGIALGVGAISEVVRRKRAS
jgi:membrane protein DedA with SNARE-associated domain